jgi:hypothetical protein
MCEMLQLNTTSNGVCAVLIMRFLQAALLMLLLHCCCSQFVQWSGIAASKSSLGMQWLWVAGNLQLFAAAAMLQPCVLRSRLSYSTARITNRWHT